ncbi:MAG: T9SS type A sorting domain-containing protein [Ignavibacteriales bacterium]|nr:T9SS type A sorting domain-containing protein [Ignavibacteriales bacterium]
MPPNLIYPTFFETVPVAFNFKWNSSIGASSYRLQLSAKENFLILILDDSTITDTIFKIGPLQYGKHYYWRMNARNSAGASNWSEARMFYTDPWEPAPEKWSNPVKIKELTPDKYHYANCPTVTADGKTLYYSYGSDSAKSGIHKSIWKDSVWSKPERVKADWNTGLVDGPSISPDGKRLYFRDYGLPDGYGGWDLYYSDWDTIKQEWGRRKNLGPNINSGTDDWACMTPDNKYLYWIRYPSLPRISEWNDSLNVWGPSNWVDMYNFLESFGAVSLPASRKKIYFEGFFNVKDGNDIGVNYYDTVKQGWKLPMILNLNKIMDSEVTADNNWQSNPWITADGRKLYFASAHDSTWDIWLSKLLVDENGDTVTTVNNDYKKLNKDFQLFQNYPNPFNPETTIEYKINSSSKIILSVINLQGQQVAVIEKGYKDKGHYFINWNSKNSNGMLVSSGVYFCILETESNRSIIKMMVIK